MEGDRLNSPSTSAVTLEVLGHRLHISQDPNSKHLGTTVWDASMVFVKFLERNNRKGRFSTSRLKGKHAIELGAGCGLAGLGMALLGCDVVSTDQVEVLPLLMRNVERNTSWITQANPDSASFGSIKVAELDWGNKVHIEALDPPFDYIIGTDVVYAEHLLEPLLQTILALSGPRTTILLGYEIRSTTVHDRMMQMWKDNFEVKTVPQGKMDFKYRHPSIQLYIMDPKTLPRIEGSTSNVLQGPKSNLGGVEDGETNGMQDNKDDVHNAKVDGEIVDGESNGVHEKEDDCKDKSVSGEIVEAESGKVDDWETRRYGAMAARLLRDVNLM